MGRLLACGVCVQRGRYRTGSGEGGVSNGGGGPRTVGAAGTELPLRRLWGRGGGRVPSVQRGLTYLSDKLDQLCWLSHSTLA
jgi:hypothetical protein